MSHYELACDNQFITPMIYNAFWAFVSLDRIFHNLLMHWALRSTWQIRQEFPARPWWIASRVNQNSSSVKFSTVPSRTHWNLLFRQSLHLHVSTQGGSKRIHVKKVCSNHTSWYHLFAAMNETGILGFSLNRSAYKHLAPVHRILRTPQGCHSQRNGICR